MGKAKNIQLNLLKGFACIGVVFIHIKFPGLFGQIVTCASTYAVPVFFMIAGYYAYGKGQAVITRRLIKIVKIFVCAYALFFLFNIAVASAQHNLESWLLNNFNWKTPIKYICFCTIDFAIPLWYLIAMIEVYLAWLFIVKNNKEGSALKAMPVLFVLQIILTAYCETKGLAWFWKINFITRGMPWFLLGYYLHTPEAAKIRTISADKLRMLAVIGCAIAVIPTAFDLPLKFDIIGYIPFSLGLFVLALQDPDKSTCKPIEFLGECLSLYVYILHVLVGRASSIILAALKFDTKNTVYLWCRPIIVLILTIFASWIIYIYIIETKEQQS